MAGIPVHTASPISPVVATKASGVTPSTSTARYAPTSAAPTTTSTLSQPSPAQPGASAVPQPTSAVAAPTNTAPAPTATATQPLSQSSTPPPPQPGAAPTPHNITHQRKASMPVSPRTTYSNPVAPYSPAPLPLHQTAGHLTTPTRSIPPASVTSTYPGPQDLSHPPGYVQNTRASFEDRPYLNESSDSPFSTMSSVTNRRSMGGTGILNGEMYNPENKGVQEEKTVWDQAVTWAKAAGQKLSQAEEDVWRRVNGQK